MYFLHHQTNILPLLTQMVCQWFLLLCLPLGIPFCYRRVIENTSVCFWNFPSLKISHLTYSVFRESPQPKIQRGKSAYARIKQLSLKGRTKEVISQYFNRKIYSSKLFLGWKKSKIEFEISNEAELQNTV